jgi:hypothetical protein
VSFSSGGWQGDLAPFLSLRRLLPANTGMLWGLDPVNPYGALEPEERVELFGDQYGPGLVQAALALDAPGRMRATPLFHKLLAMNDVRVLLVSGELEGAGFTLLYEAPGVRAFRVDGALGRAWRVARASRAAVREEALGLLSSPAFDPAREVLLTEPGPPTAPTSASGPSGALVRRIDVRGIDAETWGDGPGWLVFAETWSPSLAAWIDGRPARLSRANIDGVAVEVPAGRHLVRLSSTPGAARAGAAITCLAALGLLLLLAAARRPGPR